MSKATPRPWMWAESPKMKGSWQLWSAHEKGIYNTWIANSKGESISTDENFANAELIVRAVNCHDELVEKLEVAIRALTRLGEGNSANVFMMKESLKRARGES